MELFGEPWYVIAGIIVAVVLMTVIEKKLKAIGKWPNKNDTPGVDRLIWTAVLLPLAVVVGLTANWLS